MDNFPYMDRAAWRSLCNIFVILFDFKRQILCTNKL